MKRHRISLPLFARLQTAAGITLLMLACAHGEALKEDIESYFAQLRESVSDIAKNPVVKRTRLTLTDRYFVRSLKRHQTIYSLIRTNSKGIVISEIIRGQTPNREYRNIANQQWFKYIARNNKEYNGFLKEEGRYYLFWAHPVILTARSGRKRFGGTAAAKVDLWDSFHKFAARVKQPFLIKLNGKSLYSNKWEHQANFREVKLDIPGVDRITVRFADKAEQQEAALSRSSESAAQQQKAVSKAEMPEQNETKPVIRFKSLLPIIIAGAVLLAVLAAALIRLLIWARYKRLINKIDKE
jgi:hypothetical protein